MRHRPRGFHREQALAAAGAITDDNGLICSINGYPEGECGTEVPDAMPPQQQRRQDEQPNPAAVAASGTTTDVTTRPAHSEGTLGRFASEP